MNVLATIRPDDWSLPLFLHLLGAMVLVGSLSLAAYYLFSARRAGSGDAARVGFRALLFAAVPSFLVMRISAQWLLDKEGLEDSEAAWVTIGFLVTDAGALALVAATVAAGLAVRRAGAGGDVASSRGPAIAAWLTLLLIAAYVVAIWAMATKPV